MHFFDKDVSDMSVSEINALFHQHEKSSNRPNRARSNATERAIRRIRHNILRHIGPVSAIEYATILESEISLEREHLVTGIGYKRTNRECRET